MIRMKCPICGEQLRPGKKDPNYLLCYNCRKKFKAPQRRSAREEEEEQTYSNIPPKAVRDKRERQMKKAYDDMLAVDEESTRRRKPKPKRYEEPDDDLYDGYDEDYDENVSKLPIIILGIAIVVVAGIIAFMLLK